MSGGGSCDEDLDGQRSGRIHRSDSDAQSNTSRQPIMPNLTSRCSVKHVVSVIETFTDFKKWLVQEIGFGGMLSLPNIQFLKLKFSSWIMSKVDVDRHAIVISERKVLKFWPADVHKVFGVPCGARNVMG